jgi:hypothetical protein
MSILNNSLNATALGQSYAIYQPGGTQNPNINTYTDFGDLCTYLYNLDPLGNVIIYFDQSFNVGLSIAANTYNLPPNVSFVIWGQQGTIGFAADVVFNFPNNIGTLSFTNAVIVCGNGSSSPLITINNQTFQPIINLIASELSGSSGSSITGTILITGGAIPTVNLSSSSVLSSSLGSAGISFDTTPSGAIVNVYGISQVQSNGIDLSESPLLTIYPDAAANIDGSYFPYSMIPFFLNGQVFYMTSLTAGAGTFLAQGWEGTVGNSYIIIWPGTQGAGVLNNDGSGNLSWGSSPTSSNNATVNFGTSLTVNTSAQNVNGYEILLNISVVVTAATGATILMGVDSTAPPTTNAVTATFSGAGTYSFSAIVPNNYYVLVQTTGTISIGSITCQACPI